MAKRVMQRWDLYWAPKIVPAGLPRELRIPTGSLIATVEASSAKAARAKAPKPYRRFKREIYVESRGPANPSWRRTVKHTKKIRRRLGVKDWGAPSESKRAYKRKRAAAAVKKNPSKLQRITRSTGWKEASAVRFVKRKGRIEVYIRRKPKGRR